MFRNIYGYSPLLYGQSLMDFCVPEEEKWDTEEEIRMLEEAEQMVIADEALIQSVTDAKAKRALKRDVDAHNKAKERVRTLGYQHKADAYKRTCKRKNYDLKYKGQTRRDCAIVPSDALGWDKLNMNIMGNKIHGVKVGYIFDVT